MKVTSLCFNLETSYLTKSVIFRDNQLRAEYVQSLKKSLNNQKEKVIQTISVILNNSIRIELCRF